MTALEVFTNDLKSERAAVIAELFFRSTGLTPLKGAEPDQLWEAWLGSSDALDAAADMILELQKQILRMTIMTECTR